RLVLVVRGGDGFLRRGHDVALRALGLQIRGHLGVNRLASGRVDVLDEERYGEEERHRHGYCYPPRLKLMAIEMRSRVPPYGRTPCESQLGNSTNMPACGVSRCDSPSAAPSGPANVRNGAYMTGATPRGSWISNSPPRVASVPTPPSST